ncbi:MAG: formate C-acetyltransferase/glycerol dehydratase family glycyl radical enzyme [Oscillospiraceae bacterium]|nr:formate C-acetyltransferase/glycerol dehydratase family glycyl radical enzyme [Oscillospiraceae bacterium]
MSEAKRVSSIAEKVEPYDKVWGVGASGFVTDPSPFERINLILDDTERTTNGEVIADRALVLTEAYKKYRAEPHIIKVAKAMAEVLHRCPVYIYDHELVVGTLQVTKKNAPVFPEFGLNWLIGEMEDGLLGYSENRTHDYFTHTQETYEALKGIQADWMGESVDERLTPILTEDEIKGSHMGKGLFLCNAYIFCGAGHLGVNYDRLLHMGFGGIHDEIEAKMAELDESKPEDAKKMINLKADLIANEACTDFILRHANLALEMADKESDQTRRQELLQIAENCSAVARGVPQTFWQAIQAVHFANTLVLIESNGHSISYGRFDQYMYPFYRRDIDAGVITREQCQELIENFNIKIWDMNKVRDHVSINIFANGGIGGPCLTVGGIKQDGTDGTNDLTFMMLDAVAHTRIPCPWTAVRLHAGTPRKLLVKVANLIRLGLGEPKIFNDDVTIPSMVANGRTLEDARDYQVVGCVEPDATGKEYGWHDAAYFNINKVLELAINGGRCMECSAECPRYAKCVGVGKQLGPNTGSLETFTDFQQVLDSYDKQMAYWCGKMIAMLNKVDLIHQEVKPLPLLSGLMEGPVEKGVDITQGGAKYNFSGPQGVGVGSVGDGLATIRQLVFEEKKVTGKELLEAVRANWVGHEKLYAYINSDRVHHYGNDDDYADQYAKFGLETYCKYINGAPTAHGGHFEAGAYSVAVNVALGMSQHASIEGRKAWEPISDCMGAVHTLCCPHDVKGPSAICNSVTKLDHSLCGNGTLLNWKFSPSALEGDAGRDSLIALMETYIQRKGMHSQFTVASRDSLLEAQKNPKDYRDLLVRVAGYSAYFVELSRELQDDIIGRTELSF